MQAVPFHELDEEKVQLSQFPFSAEVSKASYNGGVVKNVSSQSNSSHFMGITFSEKNNSSKQFGFSIQGTTRKERDVSTTARMLETIPCTNSHFITTHRGTFP